MSTPTKDNRNRYTPSAPSKSSTGKTIDDVIHFIKSNDHRNHINSHELNSFKDKLNNKKTIALERDKQNSTNRTYIDTHEVNPRYVYKIAYGSVVDRELNAYEKLKAYKKLKKSEPENIHFLRLVSERIQIDDKYSMFILFPQLFVEN